MVSALLEFVRTYSPITLIDAWALLSHPKISTLQPAVTLHVLCS